MITNFTLEDYHLYIYIYILKFLVSLSRIPAMFGCIKLLF